MRGSIGVQQPINTASSNNTGMPDLYPPLPACKTARNYESLQKRHESLHFPNACALCEKFKIALIPLIRFRAQTIPDKSWIHSKLLRADYERKINYSRQLIRCLNQLLSFTCFHSRL
ncbi:hypothetical protein CEXT_715141 [Caerostris extrusa]|uniref:Uncharacterized protein n=1 Tax=Caerostris extrusa TaxID=172846 RepID=A0AAV4X3R1_CAEEX|nr:hypothetical protein CEXT_715141 [Caerostris extrusa]